MRNAHSTGSLRHPTVGVPCCRAASVLVHTDRCAHPRATEAMQILLLRRRNWGVREAFISCHGALSSALAS